MSDLLSPAYKVFISDLNVCKIESDGVWNLELKSQYIGQYVKLKFDTVWLQGRIVHTADNRDIMIVNDKTGNVKVTQCSSAPGDNTWLTKGVYCSVIGTLVKQDGIPEVAAIKLTNLNENSVYSSMWPIEVQELKLVLTNQTLPSLLEI